MRHRLWPAAAVAFLLGLVAIIAPGWGTAAPDLGDFPGYAEIDGPLRLELTLSPPISTPGETLFAELRLTNQSGGTRNPLVAVQLPASLRPEREVLPAGATLNLQTNELMWLPTVSANGGQEQIAFPLRVETADLNRPEQTVTTRMQDGEQERSAAAAIWIGIAPQIGGFLHPTHVAVGQPVLLRAEVGGSGPFARAWRLGDGRQIAVEAPEVVYSAPGIYLVELEATNPLGSASASRPLTVVPHPAAQFTVEDSSVGAGEPVTFVNQSGGQPPLNFNWEFGDGGVSNVPHPSHVYEAPGRYQVHLRVENEFGLSEAFWQIEVGAPPVADMVVDESGRSGESLAGQAFGDETVTQFLWDMGDGGFQEGELISHIYHAAGDYYVSVTASNPFGSSQVGRWVHINQGISRIFLPMVMRVDLASGQVSDVDPLADPFEIVLEPVDLDGPFILEPVAEVAGAAQSDQLLFYINEVRHQFELPPLTPVPALYAAAQAHTSDMAGLAFTAHTGSDGSFPAERQLSNDYFGGYAGEATAWGFEDAHLAVEFWVNSPAHRRIILNRYATDIGVGYTQDYGAPNVWYWTAEFGNRFAAATQPLVRLSRPAAAELETPLLEQRVEGKRRITDAVSFSWNWPLALEADEQFVLYLGPEGELRPVGTTAEPSSGSRYLLEATAYPDVVGYQTQLLLLSWQVRLETSAGQILAASEPRPLVLAPDPDLPVPTPVPTIAPEATQEAAPTPTPTPFPVSTPTPRPPAPTPPPFVTATPSP